MHSASIVLLFNLLILFPVLLKLLKGIQKIQFMVGLVSDIIYVWFHLVTTVMKIDTKM